MQSQRDAWNVRHRSPRSAGKSHVTGPYLTLRNPAAIETQCDAEHEGKPLWLYSDVGQ